MREKTREFFQLIGPGDPDEAGSVLTGWVTVLEWMNPDGREVPDPRLGPFLHRLERQGHDARGALRRLAHR